MIAREACQAAATLKIFAPPFAAVFHVVPGVNFTTDARNVKTPFGYYPRGLVANMAYPFGSVTNYNYDAAGTVAGVTGRAGA